MRASRSLPKSAASRVTVMREPLSIKSNCTSTEARGDDNTLSNLSATRCALVSALQAADAGETVLPVGQMLHFFAEERSFHRCVVPLPYYYPPFAIWNLK